MSTWKKNSVVLIGMLGVWGCGADDGAMGPAGTPGVDGPEGTQGPQGNDGPPGTDGTDPVQPRPELDTTLRWYGDNRDQLQAMIDAVGLDGNPNPSRAPVAIFDWDNTVIKNDIGDGVTFYMLRKNLILQPAAWSATSPHLTPAALISLGTYCPLSSPGSTLDTTSSPNGLRCADAILCSYYDGRVWDGSTQPGTCTSQPDFPATTATMEPSYAWTVSLQAGHTPDEMLQIGKATIEHMTYASLGETQSVGTGQYNRFLRIYDEIADLIYVTQQNGFDVWVVSASSQHIVEAFAHFVGVAPDHVIGVRATVNSGVLTHDFQGCGDQPDGNQSVITYRDGKRCWINKLVFPSTYLGDATDFTRPSPIAFGAGDSNTDLSFLLDATEMKLVINRNKTELMCNAYDNAGGNWLVNPMFIQPKGKLSAGYDCSAYNLPAQQDTVYGY